MVETSTPESTGRKSECSAVRKGFTEEFESETSNGHDGREEEKHEGAVISGEAVEDEVHEVHFDAIQLFCLRGRVTHEGRGLSGVEVDGGPLGVRRTGTDGRFSFEDVEENTEYRLCLRKRDYVFPHEFLSGSVTQDLELEITAQRLFSLSGRVMVNGVGVSEVTVEGGPLGTCFTDEEGYFCFTGVVEGSPYRLKAVKEGFKFSCDEPAGEILENTIVNFSGMRVFTVSGVVKHHGQPLAGVEVDGGVLGVALTDAEGRYVFRDVPEGTKYTLTVRKEGFKFKAKTQS